MKITISGSLGHVGKPLTRQLVAAGHQVTVISHNNERKAAIESLGAEAAIGSVSDAAFLTQALTGADAVYVLMPPNMAASNIITTTVNAGKAFATAIKKAGTPRAVLQSSLGAELPSGNGPTASLYNIEKIFSELENTAFTFLRAGYFYTNFLNNIGMIKGMGVLGANYPADIDFPVAHYEDIAAAATQELQNTSGGDPIRYIVSDIRTPSEIARVLGAAVDKPDLKWVEFTDDQALQGMKQNGMPEELAGLFVEIGAGYRSGGMFREYEANGSPVTGKVKLEDFAREFAKAFKGQLQPAK